MADIEYVIPGQPVRASTTNSIIDALAGPFTPCGDGLDFQRTSSGSMLMTPSQVAGAPGYQAPELLDVAWGPSVSGDQELVVNFGRDEETLKKMLPEQPLSVFFRDFSSSASSAGQLVALETSAFQPNGAGKSFDGWVKTGIFALEGEEGSSSSKMDGFLYLHGFKQLSAESGKEPETACVFSPASKASFLEDEVQAACGWEGVSAMYQTPLALVTPSSEAGGEKQPGQLVRVKSVSAGAAAAASEQPWTWKALKRDAEGNVLSGMWTNCCLQVGMHMFADYDVKEREQKEDGLYYCQYDVDKNEATVKLADGKQVPDSSLSAGLMNFYVGTVLSGEQSGKIFQTPVVYLYL